MKKTDVYVVVDTPKKAKKLKKVLDMFGERTYSESSIQHCLDNTENVLGFDEEENAFMSGYVHEFEDSRTKVSIKELRNILAKEHLKGGDVVVMRSKAFGNIILEVRGMDGERIDIKNELFVETGSRYKDGHETIGKIDFIRYATEEEKALLEPKNVLEDGWFKHEKFPSFLVYIENIGAEGESRFGFNVNGSWFNKNRTKDLSFDFYYKATPQEVEKALIEEAKRRGFVNGGVGNNSNIHDKKLKNCELFFNNQYDYDEKDNLLRVILDADITWTVFKDGQWANIIEQDKLANLKEAFNNGYCVEFYDEKTDTWKRHENPCWNTDLQWRIMVNNGHLVISDVYLLNQIKNLKKSIEEIKSNIRQ